MGSDDRHAGRALARPIEQQLYAAPRSFEFYQAVALLERFGRRHRPVGETAEPAQEAVRFASRPGLDFPPADIDRLEPPADPSAPPVMTVNFLGLAGHFGPLPDALTELIQARGWRGDTALQAFLDVFNHRLVSLFYRARKKHRPALSGCRPEDTPAAGWLYALIGLGTPGLRGRKAFLPDRAVLSYAGLMARRPHTLVGLQVLIADAFGVPARVEPFVGDWLALPPALWTVVGGPKARNTTLGVDVVLGRRVWDQQAGFAVHLGPLGLDRFRALLPVGGRAFQALVEMVRLYIDDAFAFDVVLALDPAEVPGTRVSAHDGARLGWTSWLKTGTAPVGAPVGAPAGAAPVVRLAAHRL